MGDETRSALYDHETKKNKRFCFKGDVVLRVLAYIANIVMIIVASFAFSESYGSDSFLAMLLFAPPVLSIMALRKQGDREECNLKKRIRKAYLRKELKALSEFDV